MEGFLQDLRFGFRMLSKKPAFTALAVLVLALGIGANTSIFSLVNAFLLRPLPVEEPGDLYQCFNKSTRNPSSYRAFSYPDYVDLRNTNSTFSRLAAFNLSMVGLTEGEATRRVFAAIVTANYFDTFGVSMTQGRAFSEAEEAPGAGIPVAIVSCNYWKKRGADVNLVGKSLQINGRFYTIVGISPKEFTGTMAILSPEIWLPLGVHEQVINDLFVHERQNLGERRNHCLFLIGRIRQGLPPAKAEAELAVAAARLEKAYPAENKDYSITSRPLNRMGVSTGPQNKSGLGIISVLLLSMSGIVLLIACLNLANMLMASATGRRKEFAIRLAIGGCRSRILRQLLTEGLILSVVGSAAGLVLSYWATSLLVSSMSGLVPLDIVFHSGPDGRVLAALIGFCVLSTLASGLGPALRSSRPDIIGDLKESAGEDAGGHPRRWYSRRNLLVIAQLALSLALLVSAGLFIRSATRAASADPGFNVENELILETDPSLAGYSEARSRETYRLLLDRLRGMPGVESASIAATVPFGIVSLGASVSPVGDSFQPGAIDRSVSVRSNIIGADYFATLGLPVLRGRVFGRGDESSGGGMPSVVIDDVLARKLWQDQDPLGKRLQTQKGDGSKESGICQIIGVVGGVRENLFEAEKQPHVYFSIGQKFQPNMTVHLKLAARGREAEAGLIRSIRSETQALDERLPILALKTMRGHLESNIQLWIVRTGAWLFTIFGLLALFLAVVGVYGVKAYTVARRTREIGLRMAMGATPAATLKMILSEGTRLTGIGIGAGLLLSIGIGRVLSSLLFDVASMDALVFIAAPALLTLTSLLACYVPAHRASRVDPIIALHHE